MASSDQPVPSGEPSPEPGPAPPEHYFLVLETESSDSDCSDIQVLDYNTLSTLVLALQGTFDNSVHKPRKVHVICGHRLQITKGPRRHLLVPGGAPIPLFDTTPPSMDPDTDLV